MLNMHEVIEMNITDILKSQNKSLRDLQRELNIYTPYNVDELNKISEYLGVSIEEITKLNYRKNVLQNLIDRVESKEAKKALEIADKLSEMIIFYSRSIENEKRMLEPL